MQCNVAQAVQRQSWLAPAQPQSVSNWACNHDLQERGIMSCRALPSTPTSACLHCIARPPGRWPGLWSEPGVTVSKSVCNGCIWLPQNSLSDCSCRPGAAQVPCSRDTQSSAHHADVLWTTSSVRIDACATGRGCRHLQCKLGATVCVPDLLWHWLADNTTDVKQPGATTRTFGSRQETKTLEERRFKLHWVPKKNRRTARARKTWRTDSNCIMIAYDDDVAKVATTIVEGQNALKRWSWTGWHRVARENVVAVVSVVVVIGDCGRNIGKCLGYGRGQETCGKSGLTVREATAPADFADAPRS